MGARQGNFCNWMKEMEVSSAEAAELLQTTQARILGYEMGRFFVTPEHAEVCRALLARKIQSQEEP